MAFRQEWIDATPEQKEEYRLWMQSRPLHVQKVIESYPPTKWYRIKSTGQIVWIYSYGEEESGKVTLKVNIEVRYNNPFQLVDLQVFGILPEDLEECDTPKEKSLRDAFHKEAI